MALFRTENEEFLEKLEDIEVSFIRSISITSKKDGDEKVLRVEQNPDTFTITKDLQIDIVKEIEEFYLSEDKLPDLVLVPTGHIRKMLPRYLWGMTIRMYDVDIVFVPYLKRIVGIEYTSYNDRIKIEELMKNVEEENPDDMS